MMYLSYIVSEFVEFLVHPYELERGYQRVKRQSNMLTVVWVWSLVTPS